MGTKKVAQGTERRGRLQRRALRVFALDNGCVCACTFLIGTGRGVGGNGGGGLEPAWLENVGG